jgi:hypothetical protein
MTLGEKVYDKDGYTRIVLTSGDWGYRLSCTNKTHDQHKQYKCYLASLWSEEQTIYNGYSFDPNIVEKKHTSKPYLPPWSKKVADNFN